jgi:hypothetical protein
MKSHTHERKPPAPLPATEAPLLNLAKAWDRFWFTPADPTTLGLMRLLGGLLTLYVTFCYTFDLLSYVGGDRAWLDSQMTNYLRHEVPFFAYPPNWVEGPVLAARGQYTWSIFFHIKDPVWVYVAHFSILGVMLLFTLGLWTRITSVLSWCGVLSYIMRAPTTVFGMDTMMGILLFYLMIGPSGAALSLDRLLQVWREKRRHGPGYVPAPPAPSVLAGFVLRCVQVHFCFIYLASGTSKLLGGRWWNGTAIWYCLANYSFAPMTVGAYYETLVFLCKHRWLWEIAMTSSVVFTLFVEIGFPFLVWIPRLRWLMVAGAVLLHTGIGLGMGLVTFSLFMLVLVLSFIPGEAVRHLLAELKQQLAWLRGLGRRKPVEKGKEGTLVPARS